MGHLTTALGIKKILDEGCGFVQAMVNALLIERTTGLMELEKWDGEELLTDCGLRTSR